MQPRKHSFSFWFAVVMIGLVLYVLSIGPAAWTVQRYEKAEPVLKVVYLPVLLVATTGELPYNLMCKYMKLWVDGDSISWEEIQELKRSGKLFD